MFEFENKKFAPKLKLFKELDFNPFSRPVWFSADENDDENDPVCQALDDLNENEIVDENNLEKMVNYLLTRLCEAFSEQVTFFVFKLTLIKIKACFLL